MPAASRAPIARPWSSAQSRRPKIRPSTTAYTAVDQAESERERAFAVNAGIIACAAAARGLPVIHRSTDYVYDGRSARPYFETDPVAPLNTYGASKAAGGAAVA